MIDRIHRPDERRTEFLLIGVALIWALNAPLVKYGLMLLDVYVFNGIRYIVATLLIAGLLFTRQKWNPVMSEDWPRFVRLGFLANVAYQLMYILGIKWTTAGNSSVLLSTSPLWTTYVNARMQKERVPPQAIVGMVVSMTGIILMIVGSGMKLEFGSNALFGDLLSLSAAILWALNTTLQKPLLVRYSSTQLSLISIGIGAVALSLLAVPSTTALAWRTIPLKAYFVPVVSGGASIALANVWWSRGVKVIGPRRTAVYNNLVPVVAFIASYFMLHEEVYAIQALGAAFTVLGVWVARR